MAEIGINIKTAGGEMRDVSDIIDDLGGKWNTLSAEQQQNLGLQIAGRFQLSRFLILMGQYDQALESTNVALNSAGSGFRENEEYLKSYEAQINMVRNAWTESILAMRDSGLGDGMILGLQAGLEFFKILTLVIDKIGIFPTVIGLSTAALFLFKKNLIDTFKGLPAQIAAGSASMRTFSVSTALARVSVETLKASLASVGAVVLPIAAFMLLGAAISAVTSKVVEQKQAQKELKEEIESSMQKGTEAVSSNREEMEGLLGAYERLSAQKDTDVWSTEKEEEYLRIQQELGEMFPSIIQYIDTKGQSHLKTSEEIQKEVAAMEDLLEAERLLQLANAKDDYKEKIKDIEDYADTIEKANAQIRMAEVELEYGNAEDGEKRFREAEVEILIHQKILADAFSETNSLIAENIETFLDNLPEKAVPAVRNAMQEIASAMDISEADLSTVNLMKIQSKFTDLGEALQEAFKTGNRDGFSQAVEDFDNDLKELGIEVDTSTLKFGSMEEATEKIKEALELAGVDVDEFANNLEDAGESTEQLHQFMEGLEGSAYLLKETIEQLAGVSKNHVEDTDELLWQYEQLEHQLDSTAFATAKAKEAKMELGIETEALTLEEERLLETYRESEAMYHDLLDLYPNLLTADQLAIMSKADVIKAIEAEMVANDQLIVAMGLSRDGKLTSEEEKSKASLIETNQRIKDIIAEINALEQLSRAYANSYRMAIDHWQALPEDTPHRAQALADANEGYLKYRKLAAQEELHLNNLEKELLAERTAQTHQRSELAKIEGVIEGQTTRQGKKAADAAKKAADAAKKSAKATKDADKAAKDYNITIKESIYLADTYKEAMEKLNLELAKINSLKSQYPTHSKAYRDALEKEYAIEQAKLQLMKDEGEYIKQQIKTGNVAKTGVVTTPVGSTGSSATGSSAQATVWNYFKARGLDDKAVAGIMGNIQQESGFNSKAVNKSSGASGIFQWLGSRKTELQNYAKGIGKSWDDLQVQLEFAWKELNSTEKKSLTALKNRNLSAAQQASEFDRLFERSGRSQVAKRQSSANQFYNQFAGSSGVAQAQSAGNNSAAYYLNQFRMTSGFGPRNTGIPGASKDHQGADFAANAGTSIKSVRDGKVIASLYHTTGGNIVSIQQDDGTVAKYMHMQSKSNLSIGQAVKAGQEIGKVGSTGVSSGPHLHLQIEQGGKAIDPLPYLKAQGESISQASQIVAENLQDIDALKSALIKNEIDIIAANDALRELERALISSQMEEYDRKRHEYQMSLDTEIEKVVSLDTASTRYMRVMERQHMFMGFKQQVNENEINYLNALIKSNLLTADVLEEVKDRVKELTTEMMALNHEMQELAKHKIDAFMTRFTQKTEGYNYSLERSKLFMETLTEGTAEWVAEGERQIVVLEAMQKNTSDSIRNLQKLLATTENLSPEMVKEYTKQLQDYTLEWLSLGNSIVSTEKQISDSTEQSLEKLADNVIDAYKKVVQERQEAHMRAIEKEIKAENDRHQNVMDNYRDEMDAYRKVIQQKLDAIDKEESDSDYNKEMAKLREERLEILKDINLLSMDDSYEAKSKRKKLQEDLADIDETIADRQHKREVDLRKENLQDMLKDKEDQVEGKEKLENDRHDNEIKRVDKEREYYTQYYNDILNDERKFAKLREDIMAENFDAIELEFKDMLHEMNATMPELENTMDGTMAAVGTSIRKNIIDSLQEALDLMGQISGRESISVGNAPSQNWGGTQTESFKILEEADLKVIAGKFIVDKMMPQESNRFRKDSIKHRGYDIADEGRSEGSSYDSVIRFDQIIAGLNPADLAQVADYLKRNVSSMFSTPEYVDFIANYAKRIEASGGGFRTGGWTGQGGLGLLHEEEFVLNKGQTKEALKMESLFSNLNHLMNRVKMPEMPRLASSSPAGDIFEINFNVDKMTGNEQDVNKFTKMFTDKLKRDKGVRFP